MFDTSSPMKVGDFDMQRVKTMFDTSTGRSLPSSKFATIKFDTTPRAFRSHVTGCYRPEAAIDGSGEGWCCVEPIVNIGCSIESARFRSRVLRDSNRLEVPAFFK
jgi:hypothetical protein